jgi:glycosyltransferase involved in cell wall biosynthesis
VDLGRFEHLPSREAARSQFEFHTDRIVVGYIGRLKTLGMEKGVSVLLDALAMHKEDHRFFGFIVGGPEQDRVTYAELARAHGLTSDDVQFIGEISSRDVPTALVACDILAMPFPDFPHYRLHMSPLKMFEYMAAGKPVVTSDLPTIRDVLDERSATFCTPGDSRSLRNALQWIADHPDEAAARAEKAHERVKRHTWEERMGRILKAILAMK